MQLELAMQYVKSAGKVCGIFICETRLGAWSLSGQKLGSIAAFFRSHAPPHPPLSQVLVRRKKTIVTAVSLARPAKFLRRKDHLSATNVIKVGPRSIQFFVDEVLV